MVGKEPFKFSLLTALFINYDWSGHFSTTLNHSIFVKFNQNNN